MSTDFSYNQQFAKIQGLSVQVGELFSDLYRKHGEDSVQSLNALESYKSLRRLLPRENKYDGESRHIGACAAHKATQGM